MVTRTRPLSREANEVQPKEDFQSNVIKTDIVTDLLEEENHTTIEMRTGLTEVQVTIAGKSYRTLIDLSLIHIYKNLYSMLSDQITNWMQ